MLVATQRCNNLTASNKLKTSIKETKQPTPWEGNKKKKERKKRTTLTRGCAATTELYKFLSIVCVCLCVGFTFAMHSSMSHNTPSTQQHFQTVLLRNSLKLFWIHPDTHPFPCQYSIMRGVSHCSSSQHTQQYQLACWLAVLWPARAKRFGASPGLAAAKSRLDWLGASFQVRLLDARLPRARSLVRLRPSQGLG